MRRSFRRQERVWILVYLGALLVGAIVLVVPVTRGMALAVLKRGVDATEARWDARLVHGLAMVEAGRYDEAATYLERLDRNFPAPTNRARRDKQREALLLSLARSYEQLGRRGKSLRTYERLVAFDDRNFRNHYELAAAHIRMARGWSVPVEAVSAFQDVLAINANHLPSVRETMRFAYDRGDFSGAVEVLEKYLSAFLMQNLHVTVGDSTSVIRVPIDGRSHEVRILLPPTRGQFQVQVATNGFTMALSSPEATWSLSTGAPAGASPLLTSPAHWQGTSVTVKAGRYVVTNADARLFNTVQAGDATVTELRFDAKVLKPVDPETWAMAKRSYGNLLDRKGLIAAEARAQLIPAALADTIMPYSLF